MIKRWLKRISGILFAVGIFVAAPLIYPSPLFAFAAVNGQLSVHSDQPIPVVKAKKFLADVRRRMKRLPELSIKNPMQIYIANNPWRRNWLWVIAPKAGGFVAPPATGWHAFFSGADFMTDELIAPSGYRTQPPRTLAYYGAHELTHVVMSKKLGWVRFHMMPKWVREGLPDYVAMPQENAATLFEEIKDRNADLAMMKAHGVYAPYRLLVTWFLEEAHWPVGKLMASNLSLNQAQAIVFAALE